MHTEEVKRFFSDNADDYAALFDSRKTGKNVVFHSRLELALSLSSSVSGRLLDCAVGPGEISAGILKSGRFSEAVVVDLSPRMLELAQMRMRDLLGERNKAKTKYVCRDIFDYLSAPDHDKYDLVLCLGLIAHTGHLAELLHGLSGILSKDGMIMLQSTRLEHLGTKVERFLTSERYYRRFGYRISYYTDKDIADAAKSEGLIVANSVRYGFGLPFADKLWPRANCWLESVMRGKCGMSGSEAIYVLRNKPS